MECVVSCAVSHAAFREHMTLGEQQRMEEAEAEVGALEGRGGSVRQRLQLLLCQDAGVFLERYGAFLDEATLVRMLHSPLSQGEMVYVVCMCV